MRTKRFSEDKLAVALLLSGSLLSSYVVGLPILVLGLSLALWPRA